MLRTNNRDFAFNLLMIVLAVVLGGWFIFSGKIEHSISVGPRSYEMGLILWTPFGEETPEDMASRGVDLILNNSEHILVQVPWAPYSDSVIQKVTWMSEIATQHDRRLTIALDWMDKNRNDLLKVDGRVWSFNDLYIKDRFIRDVSAIAEKYQPEYFILGVEVDYLARKNPDEFRYFVDFYRYAYDSIKAISPTTKVTVTFQFEETKGMHGGDIPFLAEPYVEAFGNLLDILGLAVYPCQIVNHPDELPIDYFTSVIPPNVPVAIFETGWPANSYDEEAQAEYLGWLLSVANTITVDPLIWVSTIDSKNPLEEDTVLASNPCSSVVSHWSQYLGLWKNNGSEKMAANIWKYWLHEAPRITESHEEATKGQINHTTKPHY